MLVETWGSPFVDPERDVWLVVAPDGAIAGYGEVTALEPVEMLDAFIRVHPAHHGRGIGAAMLDRAEAMARARLGLGRIGRFTPNVTSTDRAGRGLLESRGYTHVRTFLHMERALPDPEAPGAPPPGVAFRPFDEATDWPVFHRLVEESFHEHWGFQPVSIDDHTASWRDTPFWRADLVWFAEVDGEPVGFVVSFLTSEAGLGWVGEVGVVPTARGRGVAQALLRRSFADLAAAGCVEVRLNVDAENATGATRLYRRVGMTERREWLVFEKALVGA